jgi:hypothetical protein
MFVVDSHIYVVEHICRIRHISCITKYVVENSMLFSIICCLTEYVVYKVCPLRTYIYRISLKRHTLISLLKKQNVVEA